MNYFSIVLLWIVSTLSTRAQVTFSPEKPQKGQPITFTYSPKGTPLENETDIACYAVWYGEPTPDSKYVAPKPVALVRQGAVWVGKLPLTNSTSGVALAFLAGYKADHNQENLYSVFVHGADEKPVQYARSGLASLYNGIVPYAVGFKSNLDKVLTLYDQEIAHYPHSKARYELDILGIYSQQKKEGYKDKVQAGLDRYFATKQNPAVSELNTASHLYSEIGNETKGKAFRQEAVRKDPKGLHVQSDRSNLIQNEKDWVKTKKLFAQFERDFGSDTLSDWTKSLANDLARGYIEHEDLDSLKQFMAARPRYFSDPSTLNNLAWQLVEQGKWLPFAEELSKRSLENLKDQKQPKTFYMPLWVKWEEYKKNYYRQFQTTYGSIQEKQGQYDKAYEAYKESINPVPEQSEPDANERFILSAVKTGHTSEAQTRGEQFIRLGKDTPKLREAVRSLLIRQGSTAQKADAYIAELQAPSKTEHRNEILKLLVSEPAPAFSLTDLNGNPVSLADLKGKIVVLDFWATWCGPCVASFPAMQQAQTKFAQNPAVKFLFVNTGEGKDEASVLTKKVAAFLEKKKYSFTVPMDLKQTVTTAYKVEGLPTKIVIDQQGNIRYRSVGFSGGAEKTVDEISTIVEMLNAKPADGKTD